MNKRKNFTFALGSILVLVSVLALTGTSTGQGPGQANQSKEVVVINSPNNPVPVTGNVDINGTASVSVTNSPTVSVQNSSSGPLSVCDSCDPAKQAFAFQDNPTVGAFERVSSFTVPEGYRLVLEQAFVSAAVVDRPEQKVYVQIQTSVGGVPSAYGFVASDLGVAGVCCDFRRDFIGGTQMRLYADPGTLVRVVTAASNEVGGVTNSFSIHLSGYLVRL